MKKLVLFLVVLALAGTAAKAQNIDSLQQLGIFTNLDSALRYPDKVKTLTITDKSVRSIPVEILLFPNLNTLYFDCRYIYYAAEERAKREQKWKRKLPEEYGIACRPNFMPKKVICCKIRRVPDRIYEEIGSLKNLKEVIINCSRSARKKMEKLEPLLPEGCVFDYTGKESYDDAY